MNALKASAGVLGLVDSVLGLYLAYAEPFSSTYGALTGYLFWLSVVLLAVSLLCVYGVHYALPAAAVLAAGVALDAPFALASESGLQWVLVVVSAVVVVVCVIAFRRKSGISEQANPMNLPVFG